MQQTSEEQLYRTATGPKPQTFTTAWRHTCSTKPFAARVLRLPGAMFHDDSINYTGARITAYVCLERACI